MNGPSAKFRTLVVLVATAMLGGVAALAVRHWYPKPLLRSEDTCPIGRAGPADVVMLGDSFIQEHCWKREHPGLALVNRGRYGNTTTDVANRIEEILVRHPKVVVLLVGTNDIDRERSVQAIAADYRGIVERLAPIARLYVVTVPPCSHPNCSAEEKARIVPLNLAISAIAKAHNVTVIDLYSVLATPDGEMPSSYTYDGMHLNAAGYAKWNELLAPVWRDPALER